MKCKCGLEMDWFQDISDNGKLIKRYRCACGLEKAEIVEPDKPKAVGGVVPKDFKFIVKGD